jgi:hypothetical protein
MYQKCPLDVSSSKEAQQQFYGEKDTATISGGADKKNEPVTTEVAKTEGRILLFPSVASYQEHCQFLEQLFVHA